VGIARRPFDPGAHGWTKMEYRQGDVRDLGAQPVLPAQFVHEDDVGSALLRCVVAAGPPGVYNIAGDGIVTAVDIARELGLHPLPVPARPAQVASRAMVAVPFLPPAAGWVEVFSHPAVMDTARAKRELGWTPRFTALEAVRDTLRWALAQDALSTISVAAPRSLA
jgi:nucleoside-diphosphate-sugar epimerase